MFEWLIWPRLRWGWGILRLCLFQSSRSEPIADLRFLRDGCSLAVIPGDGHLVNVFQPRPDPAILVGGGREATSPHDHAASQFRFGA